MKNISLKDLLEAGCHFGHKVERWHPKAGEFIYEEREGIHIIDLVKTKDGLEKAGEYLQNLGETGQEILFVATKRQAKGVVSEAAKRAGIPYLTNRWIGGFLTNWEEVKKNIDKANKMRQEFTDGVWKKFPKHEQVKLTKDLNKLESVYTGVKELQRLPDAIFIIDIKREVSSLREGAKKSIPIVAIIDTNTNPNDVDYPIPANDDAVGSIQFIVNTLAESFLEGKKIKDKKEGKNKEQTTDNKEQESEKKEPEVKKEEIEEEEKKEDKVKKKGKKKKV